MSSNSKYSRRALLRDMGLGAAMLPLLHPRSAKAAAGAPKRLLIAINSNGAIGGNDHGRLAASTGSAPKTPVDEFFPSGPGVPTTPISAGNPLAISLDGLTFGKTTKPLVGPVDYRKDLIFLGNLDHRNQLAYHDQGVTDDGHHNYANIFTGVRPALSNGLDSGGISIDQFIADGLASQGINLPLRCLPLSPVTQPTDPGISYLAATHAFYRSAKAQVECETDVDKAFKTVFGAGATVGMDTTAIDQLRNDKKSVLDYSYRDLTAFGKRLGAEDRDKINTHMQSIRELEMQLTSMSSAQATCTQPSKGGLSGTGKSNGGDGYTNETTENYLARVDVFTDLTLAAFKCDVTRVGMLRLACSNGDGVVHPFDGSAHVGQHGLAHNPGPGGDPKARFDAVLMQKFASLLGKMKAIPEGNGTMLDNTVILWANHMGDGGAHDMVNLPWIMAGGCGGYFKTGRYLRFAPKTPLNGIFVALANAMGVPAKTFGEPSFGGLETVPGLVV